MVAICSSKARNRNKPVKRRHFFISISLSNMLTTPFSSMDPCFLNIGFILTGSRPLFLARHSTTTAVLPGPRISNKNSVASSSSFFDLFRTLSRVDFGMFWASASSISLLRVVFVSRFVLLLDAFKTDEKISKYVPHSFK